MKLIFICGCLEPGKDGVGDYCRIIGADLSHWGCEVLLLSLHDTYTLPSEKIREEKRNSRYRINRISAKETRQRRIFFAQGCITEFMPDWISIQYVPYSFHTKGLDFKLPHLFLKLKGLYQWHLMVHEPWATREGLFGKSSILWFLQKNLLRMLVTKLSPAIIHTSNSYYQHLLRLQGVKSELLHLPGNVPLDSGKAYLMTDEFSDLGITPSNREKWLVLGIFGRMRPDVSYKGLLESLSVKIEAEGKKIAFFSIGSSGAFADKIWKEIKREFKDQVLLHHFGHREFPEISGFFHCLDYGIASVPKYLLGKSGAYAAMRNHGLKVLVPNSKKKNEQVLEEVFGSSYPLDLKDEDFGSYKVANLLLCRMLNTPTRPTSLNRRHENPVY